jgi:hypothetical protein
MAVLLHEDGFVSPLEEVTDSLVPVIKKLGVDAVQLPHADGEVTVRSLDKKVVVVVHEAVSVADPVVSLIDTMEHHEEVLAVLIVPVNGFLFVPPAGDVIDSAGVFYAQRTCHVGTVSHHAGNVKIKDLTPPLPLALPVILFSMTNW